MPTGNRRISPVARFFLNWVKVCKNKGLRSNPEEPSGPLSATRHPRLDPIFSFQYIMSRRDEVTGKDAGHITSE